MRKTQLGLASVEFAIAATVFFVILIGVIEVGRALFTWNGLAEATRRGARVAAVCPVNHTAVKKIAVFDAPAGSGASPVFAGLDDDHVSVEYLDEDGTPIGAPATAAGFADIRYVRVGITGFSHRLLIPFVTMQIDAPDFYATLPRESLGIPRDDVAPQCFGTAT